MTHAQNLGVAVLTLGLLAASCSSKGDEQAVAALEELATEQAKQVEQLNTQMQATIKEFEDCISNVAAAADDSMILKAKKRGFEVPELAGKESIEALEALRTSMSETIAEQKIELAKIEEARDRCKSQLTDVKEATEEAARVLANEPTEATEPANEDATEKK